MSETIPLETGDAEVAEKLLRYRHLLPPVPADLIARMNSGGDDTAPPREQRDRPAAPEVPIWGALDPDDALDRVTGCLLGLAVGDAVGSAADGLARDSCPAVQGPVGGGPLGLAPGEWTARSAMALCLADALAATGTVALEDLAIRLNAMLVEGLNTAKGRCVGLDPASRAAIERSVAEDGAMATAGADGAAGHDALVRLVPLAIASRADPELAETLAVRQARATHTGVACLDACRLFAAHLIDALTGADKDAAMRQRVMALCPRLLFVSAGEWRARPREAIGSAGDAVDTLEAALWSVWQGNDFAGAVLTAANLGGAAGGTAAVAGALAGALYGASAIPDAWLAVLASREKLELLATDMMETRLTAV